MAAAVLASGAHPGSVLGRLRGQAARARPVSAGWPGSRLGPRSRSEGTVSKTGGPERVLLGKLMCNSTGLSLVPGPRCSECCGRGPVFQ
jgi:hypothetical protein